MTAASSRPVDLADVKAALVARVDALALELLGKPSLAGKRTWRYGRAGSLAVAVSGRKAGHWYSFEEARGGGPVDLIMRARAMDFPDAVRWAQAWLGGAIASAAPVDHQRLAEEAAAEEAARVAFALDTWNGARPIGGTLGARYLIRHRAIPAPVVAMLQAAGVARFHPSYRVSDDARFSRPAVLFAATDVRGRLLGVQAVRLDARNGGKVARAAKITNGALKTHGGAVRLPGKGAPLVTEGPEDGLSCWAATGRPVLVALGGLAKLVAHLPAGVHATVVRDGDRHGSPADLALARACDAAVEHGARVWVTPTPIGDDANAILQRDGLAAVADLVARARPWGAAEPAVASWGPMTVRALAALGVHATEAAR